MKRLRLFSFDKMVAGSAMQGQKVLAKCHTSIPQQQPAARRIYLFTQQFSQAVRAALSYISCVEVSDLHGYFSLMACQSLALWLSSSLAVENSGSQVSNHKVLSWPHNFETTDSISLDIWNRWLTLQKFNINGGSNASLVNHTSKLFKGTLCTYIPIPFKHMPGKLRLYFMPFFPASWTSFSA